MLNIPKGPFALPPSMSGLTQGMTGGLGGILGSMGPIKGGLLGPLVPPSGGMLGNLGSMGPLAGGLLSPLMPPSGGMLGNLGSIGPLAGGLLGPLVPPLGGMLPNIGSIKHFADQQIDSLLNGAISAAMSTAQFATNLLHEADREIKGVIDGSLHIAVEVARQIEKIPGEAMELIDDAERIKKKTLERKEALKRHAQRFKERRSKLPKVVAKHFEEFTLELEEELELDAIEAEKLGDKVEKDSRTLYQKTIADAEHYGTILIQQTEQNRGRAKNLKRQIAQGSNNAKAWADQQVAKVATFGSDRTRAASGIASIGDASNWAKESVQGAGKLAQGIFAEAAQKPAEIEGFARMRVQDAMGLAAGIKQEAMTAKEWARTQAGTHATWKKSMKESRHGAEAFLKSQASRVQMRIVQHGADVKGVAKDLTREQISDTAKTLGQTVPAVKKTIDEFQDHSVGAAKEVKETLHEESPEEHRPVANRPSSLRLEIDGEGLEDFEPQIEPLQKPETVHLQPKGNPREAKEVPSQPKERAKPSGKESGSAGKSAGKAAKSTSTLSEKPAEGLASTVIDKPESKPRAVDSKKLSEPEKKSSPVDKKATSSAVTTTPSPTTIDFDPMVIQPKGVTKSKEKEKPSGPVDSKVTPGMTFPKMEIKGKPTKKEADSNAAAPTPAAAKTSGAGKSNASAIPANKPESTKPKPAADQATKDAQKAGGAIKATDKGDEPKAPSKPMSKPVKQGFMGPQMKAAENAAPEDPKAFRNRLIQAGGAGSPPDSTTRAELMPHLGFDPTMARFHMGPTAHAAAKSLGADAFTVGSDVFFAEGKFDPRSPKGMGLIAHELTHVRQQAGRRDNRMQFLTKTGGDNMEQEAQDVGERVASNLSYGMGLRVGRFVRTYEPADDEPVSTRVQTKLDALSLRALAKAGQTLSSRPGQRALQLDEVLVDLQINLEESSDLEIIEQWAEAIVAAVEASHPTTANGLRSKEALAPATHVLQKKLGDPGEEQAKEPPKKVDPEVMARILKITPSATDKDMIRKLLVREHVDDMIKTSRNKQMSAEYDDAWIAVAVGMPVFTSGGIHPDDRAAIEAKLKEYDIDSYEDFLKLKADFVSAFEKKGVDIVKYMLEENLNIVLQQKKRYLSRDKADPDAPINSIRTSAQEVKKAMDEYIATIYSTLDHFHWLAIGAHSNKPNYGNLDSVTEIYLSKIDKSAQQSILNAYKRFSKIRQSHGDKHPLLLGRDFNPDMVLKEENAGDLELKLFHHFADVEKDIRYAQDGMSTDKFWELPQMVSMTRSQLGVRDGEGAAKTIDETQKAKSEDAAFWAILQAAAAIALAVTAMVATGGLAAVAMVGSAGLSVYSAAKAVDDYMFKSAAVNSSLDQARLISKDEPSLFWLAVELIGAGLDVAGAVGAFGKLATIARRAMNTTEAKALKELEEAARDAYKGTKGLAMSEDDFVARLLESAKKGVSSTEGMVKQAKLATELLEGTSARAVAIMKNDPKAIQSLVTEYGNWKGLMGSLTNGGEDAAKMSQNIGAWRQKIINELPEGAKPLDNASTEIVSDFDINVKPHNGVGAGERVLQLEKEMATKYGANWSEALLMNFYTDKSQLLTVESALKAVAPQKRAAILARVTEKSEKLNFAKMLEHAGNDPAAIKQVEELMRSAGVKHSIEDLKALGDTVKNKGRDTLLRDIDGKIKELEALPENSPQRVAKAEEITELQMEANFLTKEAYISPAAVKGGPLTNAEAYTNALSQLEMIRHVIHESGGDILKACREYELFKYINRYAGAANKAKAGSPGLTYFENLSTYIYKRARSAHMETGHLPGVTPADEALEAAVDGQWLLDQYNMFKKEVDQSLPKMRDAAEKNPAGGWKADDAPKMGGPAAGKPASPGSPAPTPSGPTGQVFTPKPSDLKSGATLPAAAIATKKAVDKAMDKDGKKPTASVGPENAVKSAGFSSSKAKEGIGMFIGTIPGLKTEVFITVMSADDRSKFEQQFGAAMAAEKTGFGPKVHGKIDMGKDKLAFATDVVKGGYADAYKSSGTTPDDQVSSQYGNKGEMMKNAATIKPETFLDVENYCKSIFESGFYYVGPVDGFVTPEGRWKPVNFYNATSMSPDTVQDEAWKLHAGQFDILKDNLMKRHLEAKGVAGKKPK